ncbi:M24 family metallopeptidase [uncultured Roseobacter sp.]|uniref:M24 family metallopeptidase n=1 Tax=uncultured Roseobacter sp. TaxID=114847 RepID=UPI00260533D4|nr:M24 family metallopeptidase [uncultured Roseobacter sp.]
MPVTDLPFEISEYDTRITRTRAAMQEAGADVIVVSDPANMAWLTGYDGWSFYVHQAVILPMAGPPLWWGRGIDALGAKRTVMMPDTFIHGYDDTYVQNPEKHPMEDLARLLADNGWSGANIGLEMDNYYFSAAAFLSLQSALSSATFRNVNGLVNWQRCVKSPAEITFMRRAARIVEKMHATILEHARPGLPKNALVAEISHAGITGADGHWGDYPSIVPLAPSGADATAPHLTWNAAPMKEGEATFFEIAGVYRRYHAPQSRTLFLGEPPDRYRRAEAAVLEAVDAGLAQARPGNTTGDIARAFNGALNRLGFEKDNRCGYSIGLSYPPDWGERTFSLRSGDTTVLTPGMTFHFMPALWLDDGGIEITEPVLITDDGAECLCTTPRELMVKT